jgi:hypothetical protein
MYLRDDGSDEPQGIRELPTFGILPRAFFEGHGLTGHAWLRSQRRDGELML